MKTTFSLFALLLTAYAAMAQFNNSNLYTKDVTSAASFTYENMRVYPVYARPSFVAVNKNIGHYLTLADALKAKKIKITEGKDAQVNKLFAQNTSKDTIIILGGEVVQGGKQDRMIAVDFILPPGKGKVDLEVYCVEHGRWSYGSGQTYNWSVTDSTAHSYTTPGYFTITTGAAGTDIRKAGGVSKNQEEVWDNVEKVTTQNSSNSVTGTYNALQSNEEFIKKVDGYKKFFKDVISADSTIIGMVVVSGDSIIGCDLFASHKMLMQHADNIIGSYATDAYTYGSKVNVAYAEVEKYMNELLVDEPTQDRLIKKEGTMLKGKSGKLHLARF